MRHLWPQVHVYAGHLQASSHPNILLALHKNTAVTSIWKGPLTLLSLNHDCLQVLQMQQSFCAASTHNMMALRILNAPHKLPSIRLWPTAAAFLNVELQYPDGAC